MRLSNLVILLLGVTLVGPALALDVPLRYAVYPQEMREFHPYGGRNVSMSQVLPKGKWKLPPLAAKIPLYGVVEFGSQKHLLVLDFTNATDKFYSRIFFDVNANGDLTDDPVVEGKSNWQSGGRFAGITFKQAVEIEVSIGDAKVRYSLRPEVNAWFQNGSPDLSKPEYLQNINVFVNTNCSYAGEFDVDGVHYSVELGDTNANGRFDDVVTVRAGMRNGEQLYGEGDSFYLNVDAKNDYENEMSLGDKLVVGEKVFQIRVNTPESKLTLTPITENLASIKIPGKVERLALLDGACKNGIMVFRPGEVVKVPVGDYRVFTYQLLREDKEGDLWRLNARGTKTADVVSAKIDGQAALKLGEPFRPVVKVPEWGRSNIRNGAKEVQISFEIRGMGDEMVSGLARIRGNKSKLPLSAKDSSRPKEPTYKIVKKDGEVAQQGQFEYG
ncbi:MAG: hypothetical protein WC655_01570 [Candidatus Hydrogenedentales bacterium]|jgi:hypothetical protein